MPAQRESIIVRIVKITIDLDRHIALYKPNASRVSTERAWKLLPVHAFTSSSLQVWQFIFRKERGESCPAHRTAPERFCGVEVQRTGFGVLKIPTGGHSHFSGRRGVIRVLYKRARMKVTTRHTAWHQGSLGGTIPGNDPR